MVAALPRRHRNVPESWCLQPQHGEDGDMKDMMIGGDLALLPDGLRPSYRYKISKLETTGRALAIALRSEDKTLKPQPGQFGVLRFAVAGKNEPHPD